MNTPGPEAAERIALHRSVAVITPQSIAVRPARARLIGPVVQLLLAALAVWLIAAYMAVLPLWVLGVLLLFVLIAGPTAVLGVVYNVAGASFLIEREKQSARWQQGFLGLGLGTHELVPFWRIARIEVESDADEELSGGDPQDIVQWEVRLVKDNDRRLVIGRVAAARPLAREGAERANALARAVAAMPGVEANLAPVPEEPAAEEAAREAESQPLAPARRSRRRFRRVE